MTKHLWIVFALAACGGGGGGIDSPSDALITAINNSCAKAFDCRDSFPPDAGVTFEEVFGTSEAECAALDAEDQADLDALEASVEAGRVDFDAGDAQVCLNGLNAATCDQFWGIDETFVEPPECDTTFIGTVADGGMCTISDDCAGADSFCDETTMTCGA